MHIDKRMFLLYIGNRTVVREHAFWYIGELKRLQEEKVRNYLRDQEKRYVCRSISREQKDRSTVIMQSTVRRIPIRRFVTGIAALVMVMSLSFGFRSFSPSAHDSKAGRTFRERYYKSVQLEKEIHSGALSQKIQTNRRFHI